MPLHPTECQRASAPDLMQRNDFKQPSESSLLDIDEMDGSRMDE